MVYELVETFKKEQASVEVTVTQLSSGSGLLDEVAITNQRQKKCDYNFTH